ncbi:MAG: peptidase dimerization protein [Gemmatimonadales bacterium]|nr:MAG: peptidase dimerization protein [Gemmatimonadales bacterium]
MFLTSSLGLVSLLGEGILGPPALAAQQLTPSAADARLRGALERPEVQAGLAHIEERRPPTVELLTDLALIVSPSGQEEERAHRVAEEMRRIGLEDVEVDGSPNAIGRIPGRSGQVVVFISTLDDLATVAEHRRAAEGPPVLQGDRLVGPGTNTSSITAAMLVAAEGMVEAFREAGEGPEHDLVFAAVAQEETGLVGMKAIYERYRDRAVGFVDILGDGRSVSYGALGIHWWRVEGEGPPGHSLGGGLPNVNQGLARAVDRILTEAADLQDPNTRTVVNVAILSSGAVFNHKPADGWFSLDVRSLEAERIEAIETRVGALLAEVAAETETSLRMEPWQIMPGGQLPGARESEIVQSSAAIGRWLGFDPTLSNAGSSNMNVAIAGGTPAIGLGGNRGGDRGLPSEWASVDAMMRSAQHVFLLGMLLGS